MKGSLQSKGRVALHLGRLEWRVLHLLAGQRLEPVTGNVGRPHALLLMLLESRRPGACLLGALLRLLLVGGSRWLCRRLSTALVSTVIRAMFVAGDAGVAGVAARRLKKVPPEAPRSLEHLEGRRRVAAFRQLVWVYASG